MINESVFQFAQLGTIVLGFVGVVVTLRSHHRQMHAQLFIEFSSRFHHVLGTLPAQTWTPDTHRQEVPPRSEVLTKSCLQCFHIIADLHHLHRGGYISRDLWKPWQQGMRRTMQGPVLRREWLAMEEAFNHSPDFCRYMQELMRGPRTTQPHK